MEGSRTSQPPLYAKVFVDFFPTNTVAATAGLPAATFPESRIQQARILHFFTALLHE